jgi:two-component system sensor kinase FixL
MQEVVDLWRPLAEVTAVRLALDIRTDVSVLRADKDKLRRVLDNLLMNAVEAIGQARGQVTIQVTAPAHDKLRISVQDDGSGISKKVQVFRLFETTKPQGTGLGLPVAREIIRAHGGDVSFERLEPHGTVFHVDLPCSSLPADTDHAG